MTGKISREHLLLQQSFIKRWGRRGGNSMLGKTALHEHMGKIELCGHRCLWRPGDRPARHAVPFISTF